jgi:hypothetical protein
MPEGTWAPNERILVRGPDGKLYAVGKTGAPQQLTAPEEQAVAEIINQAEERFTQDLNARVPGYDFGRSQMRIIPEDV